LLLKSLAERLSSASLFAREFFLAGPQPLPKNAVALPRNSVEKGVEVSGA